MSIRDCPGGSSILAAIDFISFCGNLLSAVGILGMVAEIYPIMTMAMVSGVFHHHLAC